jgi:hypothetical protein
MIFQSLGDGDTVAERASFVFRQIGFGNFHRLPEHGLITFVKPRLYATVKKKGGKNAHQY